MKQLPIVIVMLLAVLVAVVTGCDGTPRYDTRLAAADSLMRDNPDSALAIIEAINRGSLATTADTAYHDLLLTQARYRCYIVATSDSDINRALAYYRAHDNEREKLTRAYIYKGAVMEELNHPDSAMLYYKHAEATAAPDEYFNLGYTKMRMGSLYSDYYDMDGKGIQKYSDALLYFMLTDDLENQLRCLNNLGCLYRDIKPELAEYLLLKASDLSRQLNDTNYIISNIHSLLILYYYQQRYDESVQLIHELTQFPDTLFYYDLCFCAANVYAKSGQLDSAQHFFDLGVKNHKQNDAVYRMYYISSLGELSAARYDTLKYLELNQECNRISDSLLFNKEKKTIIDTEESFEKNIASKNIKRINQQRFVFKSIIIIALLVLVFVIIRYYRKKHCFNMLIAELKQENINHSHDLRELQQNINRLEIQDQSLQIFISSHMSFLNDIVEACYHSPKGKLTKDIKKIIEFQDNNKDKWNKLYDYVDICYGGIIEFTRQHYPQLKDKDLLMIALTCMGYSCAQIAIVLDYSSSAGISTVRKRIAKKMGVDGLLADYIKQFQSPHH